jgi:predicted Zn-dependent protease
MLNSSKRWGFSVIAGTLAVMLLSACAVNPTTKQPELVLMSEEDELSLGRALHHKIQKQEGLYEDERLQRYVQSVGEKVAASSDRSNLFYRFYVIDRPMVNAFALPGGYIYIYRGLLAYLNSEAELAAVLGHEIGHVTARHSVRQHRNIYLTSILVQIIAAQSGTPYGGDIANILGHAFVAGYGRDYELEADRLGSEYMARAGYDPQAMLQVIDLLKYQEEYAKARAKAEGLEPVTYHGVFATHPANDRRLQEVIEAAKHARAAAQPRLGREEFLDMLDGMVYGFSAREGIPRDNLFFHQKLGFGLAFPSGWRMENETGKVIGFAPQGAARIQLTVEDLNLRISPAQFARDRLNLSGFKDERNFEIGGLTAYSARVPRGMFNSYYSRLGIVYMDGRAYILFSEPKDGNEPADFAGQFDATLNSFHRLRPDEAELARPWTLRLLKPGAGTTYTQLGAKSPLGADAVAQLRLLNHDYPKGEPQAGLIKVVQ